MRKILTVAAVAIAIPLIFGCGENMLPGMTNQARFVEENSGGVPFRVYRDTKTGRLYFHGSSGPVTEVNNKPSEYEKYPAVEKECGNK